VRDVDGKTRLVLSVDQDGFLSLVMRERDHDTNAFLPVSKGISKAERSAYSYNSLDLCAETLEKLEKLG
jgi:hypothetical protein